LLEYSFIRVDRAIHLGIDTSVDNTRIVTAQGICYFLYNTVSTEFVKDTIYDTDQLKLIQRKNHGLNIVIIYIKTLCVLYHNKK